MFEGQGEQICNEYSSEVFSLTFSLGGGGVMGFGSPGSREGGVGEDGVEESGGHR